MVIYAILLVVCVFSIIFCHKAAEKKGRRPVLWGVIAAFIGPLAIPLVLILKPR